MGELVQDSVRRIEVPRGRNLSAEEFHQLMDQLVRLRSELIEVHGLFALLIKIEEKKNRFCVAFFEQGCEIPEVIVTFTNHSCQIVNISDGGKVLVETVEVSTGLLQSVNLIRAMAQNTAFLPFPKVDVFMSTLQIRVAV